MNSAMMIRKVLLVLAAVVVCGLIPPSGESRSAPHPVFYTDADNAEIHVKVGHTLNVSYCNPKPLPGRDCGGPFVKHQLDPYLSDDTGGGPWLFTIHSGFLPSGLVLHSNGLLTGTVSSINRLTRPWPFTICVTEFGHATSSSTKGRCATATIYVEAKAKPTPTPTPTPKPTPTPTANDYIGTWVGTLTGTITWAAQAGPVTDNVNLPVNGGVDLVFGDVVLGLNPAASADGNQYLNINDDHGQDPVMPVSGLVTLSLFGDIYTRVDDNINDVTYLGELVNGVETCTFSEQFTKQGTATTVGTIKCNTTSQGGRATVFTGTLTLNRTGP